MIADDPKSWRDDNVERRLYQIYHPRLSIGAWVVACSADEAMVQARMDDPCWNEVGEDTVIPVDMSARASIRFYSFHPKPIE